VAAKVTVFVIVTVTDKVSVGDMIGVMADCNGWCVCFDCCYSCYGGC
jgi:hypothetical protein